MHYSYRMRGTCATEVSFDLLDGKVFNISFRNGCNGNLKAISALCEGEDAGRIAGILEGNTCGYKSTSCADQFSKALIQALAEASDTSADSSAKTEKENG